MVARNGVEDPRIVTLRRLINPTGFYPTVFSISILELI